MLQEYFYVIGGVKLEEAKYETLGSLVDTVAKRRCELYKMASECGMTAVGLAGWIFAVFLLIVLLYITARAHGSFLMKLVIR